MKSIMSVNVDKFKQVQSLDFYNIIKDKIDGCEIFFNINNEEESVIEFLNKQIMLKENYDYGESVYNYLVEKLEDISDNLNKDKLTFGLELIKIKPSKRREYIMSLTNSKNKDIIDEYIQEAFVLWNKQ